MSRKWENVSYILNGSAISAIIDNEYFTVGEDHPHYQAALAALKAKDADALFESVQPIKKVERFVKSAFGASKVEVTDDQVLYDGVPVHGALVNRILEFAALGLDYQPLVLFLENLKQNPAKHVVEEVYQWMESSDTPMPITEDGYVLAYKKVNYNLKDFYTGRFDHSVGTVLEMARNEVDDDRNRTCSTGFHFCSLNYLSSYHGGSGRVMIMKINPADIVSIPVDYKYAKGRTYKYQVIGEHLGGERVPAWKEGYVNVEKTYGSDYVTKTENVTESYEEPEEVTYNNTPTNPSTSVTIKYFTSREAARNFVRVNSGYRFVDNWINSEYSPSSLGLDRWLAVPVSYVEPVKTKIVAGYKVETTSSGVEVIVVGTREKAREIAATLGTRWHDSANVYGNWNWSRYGTASGRWLVVV